jgi:hypothetical protein
MPAIICPIHGHHLQFRLPGGKHCIKCSPQESLSSLGLYNMKGYILLAPGGTGFAVTLCVSVYALCVFSIAEAIPKRVSASSFAYIILLSVVHKAISSNT